MDKYLHDDKKLYSYNGYKIVMNKHMVDTSKPYILVRTNKKRRIDKKWEKKYGYKPQYSTNIFVNGNVLIVSPLTFRKLRQLSKIVERSK